MKVCVVIRQLKGGHAPVAHRVILPPTHHVDNLEQYFESVAQGAIKAFKESFVEFNSADFHVSIVDTI